MFLIKNFPFFSFHMDSSRMELMAIKGILLNERFDEAAMAVDKLILLSDNLHNKLYCSFFERGIEETQIINILMSQHILSHIERLKLFTKIVAKSHSEQEILLMIEGLKNLHEMEVLRLTA